MIKVIKTRYVFEDFDKKDILQAIKKKDLSMRKVAKELNISVAYLSDILKGNRYITREMFEELQKILDLHYCENLFEIEEI